MSTPLCLLRLFVICQSLWLQALRWESAKTCAAHAMPHALDAQLGRKLPIAGLDPLRHAAPLVVQMHQEKPRTKAKLISFRRFGLVKSGYDSVKLSVISVSIGSL